ncbi:hypothetical protein NKH77_22270 [Streptomyces sp. M19]
MAGGHGLVRPARTSSQHRALTRAGIALSALGAALVGGGCVQAASAAEPPRPADTPHEAKADTPHEVNVDTPVGKAGRIRVGVPRQSVGDALHFGADSTGGPLKDIQLDPLAGTPVDPLNNAIGTQVADFQPVGTEALTGRSRRATRSGAAARRRRGPAAPG